LMVGGRARMRRKGALRVLFGVSGNLALCFGEDAYDWGCNFVVDDGFVVFADDVGSAFLCRGHCVKIWVIKHGYGYVPRYQATQLVRVRLERSRGKPFTVS